MRWAIAMMAAVLATAAPARGEPVVTEGVVQSDQRVAVKAVIPGAIRRLPAREGRVVARGDVLVELDADLQLAQVEAAAAEVRRATAAVAEAEVTLASVTREYERNRQVPDLITDKELALSRDAMLGARANLATRNEELGRADKQLAVARQGLELAVIPAPFHGVVSRVYLREGDTPKASETTILDFLSLDRLYVEVALPLAYLPRVTAGMPARVEVESDTPGLRLNAAGQVAHVYAEVDPVIRMARVKVGIERGDPGVRPGLFARVTIELRPASPPRGQR